MMNIPESAYQGIYKHLGDNTDEFIQQVQIRLKKYKKIMAVDKLNLSADEYRKFTICL